VEALQIGQSSDAFDHAGIEADRNLALPLDRLRELVEAGMVGEAAPRHFSIMGSLIAPARLISDSGPEIARKSKKDAVDAVLLAPVCPFCHQAAGLLQSIIEQTGVATVSISLLLDITKCVEPPRILAVDKPVGYPLDELNNADLQKGILPPPPLWTCPQCGGPMVLIERLNPIELRLRSPPVPVARQP
jgi:D-proline reductase (dithiol) PrdB